MAKNASPLATRNVIANLIDTMQQAKVTVITIDVLHQIVDECDRALKVPASS